MEARPASQQGSARMQSRVRLAGPGGKLKADEITMCAQVAEVRMR